MKRLITALVLVLFVGASAARAQCRDGGGIRFPRGKTGATVSGRVSAAKAVCYKFRARAGQTLAVSLTSRAGRVRLNVIPDAFDVDDAVTSDTTDWQGVLKGDYGDDYIITVHLPGKGSDTFTLRVSIR